MMKKIKKISNAFEFPLYILLEKRMACGIGVCFSCVCQMTSGEYSRVCIDGPIYNAKEVEIV